jgi:hypothetical protein
MKGKMRQAWAEIQSKKGRRKKNTLPAALYLGFFLFYAELKQRGCLLMNTSKQLIDRFTISFWYVRRTGLYFWNSDYGGETEVSLNYGRFYGPIVRPRRRMNE